MNFKHVLVSFGVAAATLSSPAAARAAGSDDAPTMCVALVQDVSASMTPRSNDKTYSLPVSQSPLDLMHEYPMAVMATANAIESPEVVQEMSVGGNVGVFYMEFDDVPHMRIPFSIIHSNAAADEAHNFAEMLRSLRRAGNGNTAIGLAIRAATEELVERCPNARKVIDIAGDGMNNWGEDSSSARDAAAAMGITINGLAFDNPIQHEYPPTGETYRDRVISPDGFVKDVKSPLEFEEAMKQKLTREMAHNTRPPRMPRQHEFGQTMFAVMTRQNTMRWN